MTVSSTFRIPALVSTLGNRQAHVPVYPGGIADMTSDKNPTETDQKQRIKQEFERYDLWAHARILAYRSQRDHWQIVTYILLGVSAATAIGAAISAGLKVQLWTIIFAGVTAGLSVINASLRTPTQLTKSDNALTALSALRAKVEAFLTDMPDLTEQNLARRRDQCRSDYQDALKLPSPSDRLLRRSVKRMQGMSVTDLAVMAHSNTGVFSGFLSRFF